MATGTRDVGGRRFDDGDAASSPPVAIVDESFARRLGPAGEVVGSNVRWIRQPDIDVESVGVVPAVRHRGAADPTRPTIYRPLAQYPRTTMFLVARTASGRTLDYANLRTALNTVDPTQPLADVSTMAERADRSTARVRTSVMVAAVLALIAVVLGAIGLYGVIAFGVAQRLREFGVRVALGASPGSVRAVVLREGLALTVVGITVGLVGATAIVRLMTLGPSATGTATVAPYLIGVAVVLASSAFALLVPANRAARVAPLTALRSD